MKGRKDTIDGKKELKDGWREGVKTAEWMDGLKELKDDVLRFFT